MSEDVSGFILPEERRLRIAAQLRRDSAVSPHSPSWQMPAAERPVARIDVAAPLSQ